MQEIQIAMHQRLVYENIENVNRCQPTTKSAIALWWKKIKRHDKMCVY